MGLLLKNTRTADFCADRIDVISNVAVITNVVIKRIHCTLLVGDADLTANRPIPLSILRCRKLLFHPTKMSRPIVNKILFI